MIPQLKPDIYRCIVDCLAPTPGPTHLDSTRKEIVRAQADILNLGKASRVLYDICQPKLYADCYMGNVSSLLYGLENQNAMLNKIERLHIYSGPYSDEPSYHNLLSGLSWSQLLTPPYTPKNRRTKAITEANLIEEIRSCAMVAKVMKRLVEEDPAVLSKLQTVSMGDIPNISWTSRMAPQVEIGMLSAGGTSGLQYKSLARTLVNLPKVAHACQATQFGPLGLSHGANRIDNPPAVFTCHPRLPSPFCACTEALGPIILGTLNRHYYTCLYTMEEESVIMADVIDNIVGSVCSNPISDAGEETIGSQHLADDDLGDTMLELYDYVRVVPSTNQSWTDPIPTPRGHSTKACRVAISLDLFQEILDERLPAKWRGRVVFKDREDAPPCTACGLNLAEQWEDHIDKEGVESGEILPCRQVHQ